MLAYVHEVVGRMVDFDPFTAFSPEDRATLALHADGVLQLVHAASSGFVTGELESLWLLLVEMQWAPLAFSNGRDFQDFL